MQHPLYQYVAKDDRPPVKELVEPTEHYLPKKGRGYCHIEEKWKPISDFSFFSVCHRKAIPHAACKKCLVMGLRLDNLYQKCGSIRMIFKLNRSLP